MSLRNLLEEVPSVRRDAGYPPLVTPSSQIVGSQAVFNVLMGRYKVMTAEFADLMLGYYGSTLGGKNPDVLKKAEAQAKKTPITVRPADLLKPEWEHLRSDALALEGCNGSDASWKILLSAVILTQGDTLSAPLTELAASTFLRVAPVLSFRDSERNAIITALNAAKGKISGQNGAAGLLGLKRTTLLNKMRKLKITVERSATIKGLSKRP